MEDVHSFHTRVYDKSEDLKKINILKRIFLYAKTFPILIVKLLVVGIVLIYELLKQILFWIVPKPLRDIRGQLAVVSVKFES